MQLTEHDRKILEGARARLKELTGEDAAHVFIDTAETLQFYCECGAQDCWDENELASEKCAACGGIVDA